MVLHRGTRCFPERAEFVHWLGYASILLAWSVSYAVVTTLLPLDGTLLVGLGTFIATVCSGIVAGLLYGRAIGSPIGNLLAPFVLVALVPTFVFERLSLRTDATVTTESIGYFAIVGPSAVAGMLAALAVVGYGYSRIENPIAWEREVMPLGVRVFDAESSSGEGTLAPRIEGEQDGTLRLDVVGGLKAMAVALAFITAVLYATIHYARAPPEQAGGPILLALVYVIAQTYTYDE